MVKEALRKMIVSIVLLLLAFSFITTQLCHCILTQIVLSLPLVYAENNSISDYRLHKNHYIAINDKNNDRLTKSSSSSPSPSSDKVSSTNNSSQSEDKYMIFIKKPGERFDTLAITKLLNDTGIKLDLTFEPLERDEDVMVRGSASEKAKLKAEKIPEVLRIIPDLKISSDSQVGPDSNID